MDPYDKIREQLEKAQQRGVEALTNRLDFIVESLTRLVDEARSAVAEAVPEDPEELFPVGECSSLVEEAERRHGEAGERAAALEARVRELEERLAEAERPGPAGLSLDVLRRLDAARSQSELLRDLLPLLLDFVGRAVVLVLRDGTVSAWSGIGFEDADTLRAWRGDLAASEALGRLADETTVVRFAPGRDTLFAEWLAGQTPTEEAWLIPVGLRGRVVGAIYVDRLEGGPWDPETAQRLVAVACWLIDTLSFRTKVPSPMLTEPVDVAFEPRAAEAAPAPPVGTELTPEAGYPAMAGEAAAEEREAAAEAEAGEEPAAEAEAAEAPEEAGVTGGAGYEPAGGYGAVAAEEAEEEAAPGEGEAMAAEAEEAEETEAAEAALEGAEETEEAAAPAYDPSVTVAVSREPEAVVTPPPVQPVTPPPPAEAPAPEVEGLEGLSEEERAEHEEARRFARLLVSEIKLYNPDEVEQGKQNGDIYQRLKEDIDRSREMYEQRIPEHVRNARDYFKEELVRILAEGDAEALGM